MTHSYLRYIILLLLVIVIVVSLMGLANKAPFTKKHDKLSLFLFICAHTQLLVGIILYFTGDRVMFGGETMKTPALRYFAVEHPLAMVIAITLITIGRTGLKKTPVDQAKHRRLLIYNLLALLVIGVVVFYLGAPYNTY
jgi:hypothetical protein